MPAVNPHILTWARERAGLSLEAAAKAIALNDTKKATGEERLAALEAGEGEPSRSLLRRMADKYRRPVLVFYLDEPPASGDRGEDFRRAADAPPLEFDPSLDALIRNVRVRHDLVKALLEDEDAEPLNFVGSYRMRQGVRAVAESIQETIGFDLQQFRRRGDADAAFAYLRDRMERAGLFVMLLGDLGSYHSRIDGSVFRGYAIADPIAPFIVINDNDARAAWSFTALHEAAHIWLGQTGISGNEHAGRIEQFCNDVAGSILLPRRDIQALAVLAPLEFNDQLERISAAAREFKVSRLMVAYQLLRDQTIDMERYRELAGRFRADWLRSRARDPDQPREGRGPNAHVVKRHRLGQALVDLAQRSIDSGALTPTKASRLLGVKTGSVHALLHPRMV